MKRLLALLALTAGMCTATIISEVLHDAQGNPLSGYFQICNDTTNTADGSHIISACSQWQPLVSGLLSVNLAPTDTQSPPSNYRVTYRLSNSVVRPVESWAVATTAATLKVSDVVLSTPPPTSQTFFPQQIATSANNNGKVLATVAGVTTWTGYFPIQNYVATFVNPSTTWTVSGVAHGSGTIAMGFQCRSTTGAGAPCGTINVNPANYTVTVTWGVPATGSLYIYWGNSYCSAETAATSDTFYASVHKLQRVRFLTAYDTNNNAVIVNTPTFAASAYDDGGSVSNSAGVSFSFAGGTFTGTACAGPSSSTDTTQLRRLPL